MPVYTAGHLVCKVWKINLASAWGFVRGNGCHGENRQQRMDFCGMQLSEMKGISVHPLQEIS